MKQMKKRMVLFLVCLLVILPVVSGATLLIEPVAAAETETVDASARLGDKSSLPTDQQVGATGASTAQPNIEAVEELDEVPATSDPVESSEEVVDDENQMQEEAPEDSSLVQQQTQTSADSVRNASEAFHSYVQGVGATEVYLRDESAAEAATVDWRVLRNEGYQLLIQLNNYQPTSTISNRQIKVEIPRGVLVRKDHLNNLVNTTSSIYSYTVDGVDETATYQLDTNFNRTLFVDPVNGTDPYSQEYITGATVSFEISPLIDTLGIIINLLPNYEDGTTNSPNFWTGVSGDSLTRNQPLKVQLVEDEQPVKTLLMDDFIIPSTAELVTITRGPDASTTTPGPQTLDEELQLIMQTRVRNNTENASNNAYYMSNSSYQAYLPYKEISTGQYLSATLIPEKMDAWIARITSSTSNGGVPVLKYSAETLADGRVVVTYSFVDDTQEYLVSALNLEMHYRLPSQPNAAGQAFAVGEQILYTRPNLGWTMRNYTYDEDGNRSMEDNKVVPLSDSTQGITITSGDAFKFEFHSRANPYSTISTAGTDVSALLGYALLRNETPAEGKAQVTYQFDTTNAWEYGVTTVQYWTVNSTYGGSLAASRNYTYGFNFVLQKKGDPAGNGLVRGTYDLTPSQAYQGIQISRTDGSKRNLLGYGTNERYYYYVNREMLANGTFTSEVPADFDIKDYYIKELSYELEVSSSYISGDKDRPRESGGQFYGHTFVNAGTSGKARFEITPAAGYNGNTLSGEVRTTLIDRTSNGSDVGLFLDDSTKKMTITDENNKLLKESTDSVDVGKEVTVSASALSCFYPYAATSYAPNPVFLIRTPIDLDLNRGSIQLEQEGQQLDFTIDDPVRLADGSNLYYVKPTNSKGMGYFTEARELVGGPINISYKMKVNISARSEAIAYRELLFVADQKYASYLGGSYGNYFVDDAWGIGSSLSADKTRFYSTGGVTKLASTRLGSVFNTNPPKLDFHYDSQEGTRLSSNVQDPENPTSGGILDKESTVFSASFDFKNISQAGYVDNSGRFIFYLPIAKKGVTAEWADPDQLQEFSLTLKEKLTITSSQEVNYQVGYSMDTDKKFNNNQSNFDGDNTYASYEDYRSVENNLDKVTMIKVIAQPNEATGIRIPFGEEMTATMSLGYSPSNEQAFYDLTGEKTSWKAYVSQTYTMGGARNEFPGTSVEKTMRIRYRPERRTINLWAYNESDYPDGGNKTDTVTLPNFVNRFNVQLNALTDANFTNVNLASITDIKSNAESSTSYGNTTFGFLNGLNVADIENEADPALKDLILAMNSGNLALGETAATNSLSYRIYNANNINDTLESRQVRLVYTSKDSDDIEFEVVLNINRRITLIKAKTALMAGKVYREFTHTADNPNTTLENGAFTLQYAFDEHASERWPDNPAEDDIYLKFTPVTATDQLKSSLPAGDTILMKIQSTETNVPPEYYYYKNESASEQTKIPLTQFKKMGTNASDNEFLTLAMIEAHSKKAEYLSYLFIFNFANKDTAIAATDSIGLVFDFGEDWETNYQPFKIENKRRIENRSPALDAGTYEEHEPIQLKGTLGLSDVATAVDSYNENKSLALSLALYEKGTDNQIDWPQGVLLRDMRDASNPQRLIRPKNVEGELQFVYEVGAISSLTEMPYQLAIYTEAQSIAATKEYEVQVTALRDHSGTHPLMGEVLAQDKLAFQVVPAKQNGLRVQSLAKDRLVYNRSSDQQAAITFSAENIEKIVPVLQVKVGQGYINMANWSDVVVNDLSNLTIDPAITNPFNLQFRDQLDESLNGEYRIVFNAYEQDSDVEPLYELAWTFLIWDPPS
ncbi:hypothetical protein [Enterococcus sp. AZ109]|uniref:hypothetical protein n=1 Tax=Enterococcus sp. AZ109 TaxID=2774634 RepID=UPI003F226AC8